MTVPKKVAERYEKLQQLVAHHRKLYYSDVPEIADSAYDELEQELVRIEEEYPELRTTDSPTQRVGGEAVAAFAKVPHTIAQWSFNDAFTPEDMREFAVRVQKLAARPITFTCELKIDGLKVVLTYVKGNLITAATRGDERRGADAGLFQRQGLFQRGDPQEPCAAGGNRAADGNEAVSVGVGLDDGEDLGAAGEEPGEGPVVVGEGRVFDLNPGRTIERGVLFQSKGSRF
jgi:hypothetical protein